MKSRKLVYDRAFVDTRIQHLGLSADSVSRSLGRYRAWLRRFLEGREGSGLAESIPTLATILQCAESDICPNWSDFHRRGGLSDYERWAVASVLDVDFYKLRSAAYAEAVRYENTSLTIHRGLNSFLADPEYCAIRTAKTRFAALPSESLEEFRFVDEVQRTSIIEAHLDSASECHHRVIAPVMFFADASEYRHFRWTLECIERFGRRNDQHRLTLGLLPMQSFGELDRLIKKVTGYSSWEKVAIVGDAFLSTQVDQVMHVTRQVELIRDVRKRLQVAVNAVYPDFPTGDCSVGKSASVNNESIDMIEAMASPIIRRQRTRNRR